MRPLRASTEREPRTRQHAGVLRSSHAWTCVAIAAVAVIAYAPSFSVPFQFDDEARLTNNIALQEGTLRDALGWLGTSRVIPSLTLVLNYRLGGLDPLGYHIGNFIVHLLCAYGVLALGLTLCRTPRLARAWPPDRALVVATAAGLFFVCHPLQTQAVTYVIQRSAAMAALFYVSAVVCYLRGRIRQSLRPAQSGAPWLAASAALAICAVLSKENAVSLPAALLLAEWVGFGRPQRWRRIAAAAVAMLIVVAVPVLWKSVEWQPFTPAQSRMSLLARIGNAVFATAFGRSQSRPGALAYLLTQATVLPRYLHLVVFPFGLNVDPDVPIASGLTVPVLAGAAFLAGLAALGVSQMRRRPLAAFGILWFFITLSVESTIIPIDDVMVEQRMYLPMAGLAVSAGWMVAAGWFRVPRLTASLGALLLGGLVALTFARNLVWQTPITLWLDAAEKSPEKLRPQVNLGAAYHNAGRLDEAVVHYCRALALNPYDELAADNLELALTQLGRLETRQAGAAALPAPRAADTVVLEKADLSAYCP